MTSPGMERGIGVGEKLENDGRCGLPPRRVCSVKRDVAGGQSRQPGLLGAAGSDLRRTSEGWAHPPLRRVPRAGRPENDATGRVCGRAGMPWASEW